MVLYFSNNAAGNLAERCLAQIAVCRLASFNEKKLTRAGDVLLFRSEPRQDVDDNEFMQQMSALSMLGFITLWESPDAEMLLRSVGQQASTSYQRLHIQRNPVMT
jgi:hypothetical protein